MFCGYVEGRKLRRVRSFGLSWGEEIVAWTEKTRRAESSDHLKEKTGWDGIEKTESEGAKMEEPQSSGISGGG
jgi:hypothetical protein